MYFTTGNLWNTEERSSPARDACGAELIESSSRLTQDRKLTKVFIFLVWLEIFTAYVLCSFRLFKLKTEGQTYNINRKPHRNVRKFKSNFSLILGLLSRALNNPPLQLILISCGARNSDSFAVQPGASIIFSTENKLTLNCTFQILFTKQGVQYVADVFKIQHDLRMVYGQIILELEKECRSSITFKLKVIYKITEPLRALSLVDRCD